MPKSENLLGGGKNTQYKSSAFGDKHGHDEIPLILRRRARKRKVGNTKPMKFVSLHHHSTFSYMDGFQLPDAHVRRATELNMDALAMTEHGNVSSHVKLEQSAQDAGVKPIFGCELYTGRVGPNATQKKYHLTVLARNAEGYRNLLRLVSLAYSEGFHYEPTVSWDMLKRHKEGLVILSGCQGSLLFCSFVGGKLIESKDASYARGKKVMHMFRDEFGPWYFAEVQAFPELALTNKANPMMAQAANELGVPIVGTMDCHYTEVEDAEIQKILHNIRPGNRQTLEDQAREWGYNVPLCPPPNDASIFRRLKQTGLTVTQAIEAINSTSDIAEECDVTLPRLPMVRFPKLPGFESSQEVWDAWLREGWKYRGCDKLPLEDRRRYKAQLRKEKDIIETKDFVDYHLIVADGVKFAKDQGIPVGPARGSAAASIVCWLLRITEVNPMIFPNLVFERYIDLNRVDLPDIDLDFDSDRRHEVRDYYVSKYGASSVSNLGTFNTYKAKMSLDDVARVHQIPKYEVEAIKELLIERSSGDLRASATIEDTILEFDQAREAALAHPEIMKACDLEGNVKGFGVHAAGLIISNGPITDVCSVIQRKVKGRVLEVVGMDKYDAERQGLLKLDFLGLSTMAMLAEALRQLDMPLEELYQIKLDDERVLEGFRKNDVVGVFQFDGRAMRSVNGALKADTFKELCDVNALARPGPLHNGAANEYIDIKRGVSLPENIHPAVDDITRDTNFQIVYQEQILRIVREIGDFSWTHSAHIRKIISKKVGEQEFQKSWEEFRDGALSLHERSEYPEMNTAVAQRIWGMMITAGSYAFCMTGDTVVCRGGAGGNRSGGDVQAPEITLAELYKAQESKTPWGYKLRTKGIHLTAMSDDGRVRLAKLRRICHPVTRPILKVQTESGRMLRMSLEHRLLTADGYKLANQLRAGDALVAQGELESSLRIGRQQFKGWDGMQGQGNPAWLDGRTAALAAAKATVVARSGDRCEHCNAGYDGRQHGLEFAHILSLNDHGGDFLACHSAANILRLCNSCHKIFDYGKGERKKRWTKGLPTVSDEVVSVEPDGIDLVYDVEMADDGHNYIGNGIVQHNNAAHATAYSLLSYWTMWLKQYHPAVFYAASLSKMADSSGTGSKIPRHVTLMRDAVRGKEGLRPPIAILPPHPQKSAASWKAESDLVLQSGFEQIEGVASKTAKVITDYREEFGLSSWDDLAQIKGIGPKTVEKIKTFVAAPDPFGVTTLDKQLTAIRKGLKEVGLALPTHTAVEVPYEKGQDTEVVWLGTIVARNLRDIFESNRARHGTELDRAGVKDPHLNEFMICEGYDGDEVLNLRITRWKYPKFRDIIWKVKPGVDVVWVKGTKPGWRSAREIYINDIKVLEP